MPRLLADLTPLRVSVPYRRLWAGMWLSSIGTHLTTTAVGLQVYDITGSTFSVGLVGLFALVPLVVLGLYGGSIVDAHDRRRVVITTTSGIFAVALLLAGQAWAGLENVWVMYVLVAVQNGLFGVNQPARSAILPRLLRRELMPAANALGSLTMGIGVMVGPLLAALFISWWGYTGAYTAEAVLLLGTLTALWSGCPRSRRRARCSRPGLASVVEGLRYLGTRPNVRMTFSVDLAAMVLGHAAGALPGDRRRVHRRGCPDRRHPLRGVRARRRRGRCAVRVPSGTCSTRGGPSSSPSAAGAPGWPPSGSWSP